MSLLGDPLTPQSLAEVEEGRAESRKHGEDPPEIIVSHPDSQDDQPMTPVVSNHLFQIYIPDRVAIHFHNPSLCLSTGCIPESTRKGGSPQRDATGREGAVLCIVLIVLCETVMVPPQA